MKSKRSKKAQFFIIFAVIFSIVLLGTYTSFNFIQGRSESEIAEEKFYDLCKNYKSEIARVSEYAVLNRLDESIEVKDFTITFLKYAADTDPFAELLYVYGDASHVEMLNYLNEDLDVLVDSSIFSVLSCRKTIADQLETEIGSPDFRKEVIGSLESYVPGCSKEFDGNINKVIVDEKEFEISNFNRFFVLMKTTKGNEVYACE